MTFEEAPDNAVLRHDPMVVTIGEFQKCSKKGFWIRFSGGSQVRYDNANIEPNCEVTVVCQLSSPLDHV